MLYFAATSFEWHMVANIVGWTYSSTQSYLIPTNFEQNKFLSHVQSKHPYIGALYLLY